ncbi:MAG: transposase, partial [Nitrospinae bacterium]|nr:transposase [Nitrospinota bacterium]
ANDRGVRDETGVHMALARHSARAPQGARAYASKPGNTGNNITVWGALSRDGIQAAMTVAGSTDTDVFFTDVPRVVVPTWRPGQVVSMDHLSSHTDARMQTAMAWVGARRAYVPPYAPDLSPIEACWSKVNAS